MKLLVVFAAYLTMIGCQSPNPLYCESDDDCADPYPVCNLATHGCVGSEDAGSDGGGDPGDNGGDSSDGGEADSPSISIAYVDDDACPDAGSGGPDDPFCKIQDGLSAGAEQVIVKPGTYMEDIVITNRAVIHGDPGSRIETISCPGILVLLGANATIEGLTVAGAGGIWVAGDSTATITSCTIEGTVCTGIECQNSSCDVSRSIVKGNSGGGIKLTDSKVNLENNMVIRNSGSFGGVSIYGWISGSRFVNNTVAYNSAESVSEGSGVTCLSPAVIENSILWENQDGDVSQFCTVAYSDLTEEIPGQGNLTDDPLFVDEIGDNFHIMLNSPCVDMANDAAAPHDDIDGEDRPRGLGADMGADEAY